jgi:hypothetical protein
VTTLTQYRVTLLDLDDNHVRARVLAADAESRDRFVAAWCALPCCRAGHAEVAVRPLVTEVPDWGQR